MNEDARRKRDADDVAEASEELRKHLIEYHRIDPQRLVGLGRDELSDFDEELDQ